MNGPLPSRTSMRAKMLIDDALWAKNLQSRHARLARDDVLALIFFALCIVLAYLIGGML